MCDEVCQAQYEAILNELKYHTHLQLDQLAEAVLGPVLYGNEHDRSKGLKAGQEQLVREMAEIKREVRNGSRTKVKLPWSFYGTLVASATSIIVALIAIQ
ncbi:MAG: hypothetical protein ACW99J_18615 [Candidatus Thorarchaeota archaeon]|jgi:hypothetical protein